ncbi:MAG: ankyrin repeat domain-containing protein [Solirubrobacteraceae bacterium]
MTPDAHRLAEDDPLARAASEALTSGDAESVKALLAEHPELAAARVVSVGDRAGERTLLHVFADFPGNRPHPREIVAALQQAGVDVNAPFVGAHAETALHWAASNDDVALIDALIDAGADLEAGGAVVGGGTPLADATAFGQWQAADHLLARGAEANLFQAAALGLNDRLSDALAAGSSPGTALDSDEITQAFWGACHGGRQSTASQLLSRGAELNWIGYDDLTAVDAAERSGANRLATWLRKRGGRSASELAGTA